MIEDTKTILLFIAVAIATAYIRYRGFIQATMDAVLAFLFGYAIFQILAFWDFSGEVRSGFSCVGMIFARPLFDWGNKFISEIMTKIIEKKIGGDNNDGKSI